VAWPFAEGGGAKHRPALVIEGPDAQGDITLLKVTGNSMYPDSVRVEMSDLESGLLKKTSFVRVDRAATVHFSQVKTRNVRLNGFKLAEVHKALALRNSRAFSNLAHRASRVRSRQDQGRDDGAHAGQSL
jgi:hypothetical protein